MGKQKRQRSEAINVRVLDERGRRRQLPVPGRQLGWECERRGAQLLVTPTAKARWGESSRLWRSVLLRDGRDGYNIVSAGLPKFWDAEDDVAGVSALEDEAARGEQLTASVKHDGRLAIRSVHAGRVLWRTRTSFGVEDGLRPSLERIVAGHPLLSDPDWRAGDSLQFELCLAAQRIVVTYPEDRLLLVGASSHETMAPRPWAEVIAIAAEAGLEITTNLPLRGNTLAEWQQQLSEWDSEGLVGEGVVVRDARGWPRLRLKSPRYQRAFRLRYDYPPGALIRSWERELRRHQGAEIEEAVTSSLKVIPEDQETVRSRLRAIAGERDNAKIRTQELADKVDEAKERAMSRAVFAREVAGAHGIPEGPALLKLWDDEANGSGRGAAEAAEAMWANAANRLCERMDEETVISAPIEPPRDN